MRHFKLKSKLSTLRALRLNKSMLMCHEWNEKEALRMTQLGLSYLQHVENSRHNLASETETNRSNRANEDIRWAANSESARSNRANERLKEAANAEVVRSNKANEALKSRAQDEIERSNLKNEALKKMAADTEFLKVNETLRQNRDKIANDLELGLKKLKLAQLELREKMRNNKATEADKDEENRLKQEANVLKLVAELNKAGYTNTAYDQMLEQLGEWDKDMNYGHLILDSIRKGIGFGSDLITGLTKGGLFGKK